MGDERLLWTKQFRENWPFFEMHTQLAEVGFRQTKRKGREKSNKQDSETVYTMQLWLQNGGKEAHSKSPLENIVVFFIVGKPLFPSYH